MLKALLPLRHSDDEAYGRPGPASCAGRTQHAFFQAKVEDEPGGQQEDYGIGRQSARPSIFRPRGVPALIPKRFVSGVETIGCSRNSQVATERQAASGPQNGKAAFQDLIKKPDIRWKQHIELAETPRIYRIPFGLSYAAKTGSPGMA